MVTTSGLFESIRGQLLLKRQSLASWLQATPPAKRALQLGPVSEPEARACLHDLDAAIAKASDGTLGICKVCHDYVNDRLLMMDYTACVCLDHYSLEERRYLEWELEQSQVVQRALLPQEVPDIAGLELAVFSRPAQIVSGDFFDFFQYRDGAYGVAIADVAGHGVPASLLMASVQTALRTLAPISACPSEIVQQLNRFFLRNVHFTTFVTLFLARFEPGNRLLTYVNAGHNPPLLVHGKPNGASYHWITPNAAAVGLAEEMEYRPGAVALERGDVLMLYTDGVTEAANVSGEQLGGERLIQTVMENSGLPAKELVIRLYRRTVDFAGSFALSDDATMIACRIA